MVKKWWILAVVFTLALSLTSCSKKKNQPLKNSLETTCVSTSEDGPLGEFRVRVIRTSDPERFTLAINPRAVIASGVRTAIYLARYEGPMSVPFISIREPVSMTPGREVAFNITSADIQNFPILAIVNYDPDPDPQFGSVLDFEERYTRNAIERAAYCGIGFPGQPTTN